MGHGAFGKKNQAARIGRLALAALAAACWLAAGAVAQDVISSRGSSVSETGLGNLIADAVRTSAGADAALVPASLLRDADVKVPEMNAARVSAAVVDPGQGIAEALADGDGVGDFASGAAEVSRSREDS